MTSVIWTYGPCVDAVKATHVCRHLGVRGRFWFPERTVEALAARQLRDLPEYTSYTLVGYSFGGSVSLALAKLLQARGKEVEHLIVIDSLAPGTSHGPPRSRKRTLITKACLATGWPIPKAYRWFRL